MRGQLLIRLGLVAVVASGSAMVGAAGKDDSKAAAVIADARKALGGESRLAALKGLSIRGEFRRELTSLAPAGGAATFVMMGGGGGMAAAGGTQVAGSIQIDLVWPDKFYREESSTGGLAITRVDGFEGDRPFLELTSNNPGTRVQADNPATDPERAKAAVKRMNTDLGRLLLGLIAGTQPGLAATYTYSGQAESPDGQAHVIDVTAPGDFKARLFIDTNTHLPLMLTYVDAEPRPVRMMSHRGSTEERVATSSGAAATGTATAVGPDGKRKPLADLTPEQRAEIDRQMKEAASTPPKMIEYRMFFSDYRDVSGVMLPHRIVRGTAEKTTEEWDIKDYKVNPNIKPERFKVGTN